MECQDGNPIEVEICTVDPWTTALELFHQILEFFDADHLKCEEVGRFH